MKSIHIYKSIYIDKKTGKEVEPFYIIHQTNNIKEANENAAMYILSYYRDRNKGSNFLNTLINSIKIISIRLKKNEKLFKPKR